MLDSRTGQHSASKNTVDPKPVRNDQYLAISEGMTVRPIHVASKNLDDIGTLYAHSREKMCRYRCVWGGGGGGEGV